jgi:hypothetical protein
MFFLECYHEINCRYLLLWYIFFGALHEAVHVFVAIWSTHCPIEKVLNNDEYSALLYRMLLGRHTEISNENNCWDDSTIDIIRQSGWIFSTFIAIVMFTSVNKDESMKIAAAITALESITSDFLCWNVLSGLTNIPLAPVSSKCLFYCGNFGIIVLHHLWFEQRGAAALDVLEKMIQVTMMRGAQSGGVITFKPDTKDTSMMHGIRSRCVNSKRTDLSKLIRRKVQHDVFSKYNVKSPFPNDFVTVLSGHTRFATSSKATMEGTHPHRWTPPSWRRVYQISVPRIGNHQFVAKKVMVENYVTVS